jgi:hypothetical protein
MKFLCLLVDVKELEGECCEKGRESAEVVYNLQPECGQHQRIFI